MSGRIGVVDHDLANRGFARGCLERQGPTVTTLNNGLEVRDHLPNSQFNVSILHPDTPGVFNKYILKPG